MRHTFMLFAFLILVGYGCVSRKYIPTLGSNDNLIVQKMFDTHKVEDYYKAKSISYDLELTWKGKTEPKLSITHSPDLSFVKMLKPDKSWMQYKNGVLSTSGADVDSVDARFDIFTWTYFFALPFKLKDDGVNIQQTERNRNEYNSLRLTFGPNIGDAPDDWYELFIDKKTNIIHSAMYIVTAGGRSITEAEKSPSEIVYDDYTTVNGIPISTMWRFYKSNLVTGRDKQVGECKISNLVVK